MDGRDQRFLRIDDLGLGLGQGRGKLAIESLDRGMATLHAQEVGAGLGALGADAASLASSGITGFQLSFGSLVFQKLAAWLEIDSQTPSRSWTRSRQRSELPRSAVVAVQRQTVEGASPLSTQRQNFFSAVKRRRW
jgi:hypothetical protein